MPATEQPTVDLTFSAPTPRQVKYCSGERVSNMTSYARLRGGWHATLGQTNVLARGSQSLPPKARLELGHGRMARFAIAKTIHNDPPGGEHRTTDRPEYAGPLFGSGCAADPVRPWSRSPGVMGCKGRKQ